MDDAVVLLEIASALVEQDKPDIEFMLDLLESPALDDFDVQIQCAIHHARRVAKAALNGGSAHTAIARFALFRVVRLLEQRVAFTATATLS